MYATILSIVLAGDGGLMRQHSPFPGMDPYLEDNEIWQDFNHALAEEIRGVLNVTMDPKYYAAVETHTVSQDVFITLPHAMYPDVGVYTAPGIPEQRNTAVAMASTATLQRGVLLEEEIRFRSVRIYMTKTAELVTAIEILSPFNKRGEGLDDYRKKRREILKSQTHLVELDLLRGGRRPGTELYDPPLDTDYILLVNRASGMEMRVSHIWMVALNERFPILPIPLREPDPNVSLDLNEILQVVYPRARYGSRLDYTSPIPPPELRPAMAEWIQNQFSAKEQHG
jgi:hypothetical protein